MATSTAVPSQLRDVLVAGLTRTESVLVGPLLAQAYVASSATGLKWKQLGGTCLLCIAIDRNVKGTSLRVYDAAVLTAQLSGTPSAAAALLAQQELYYEVRYVVILKTFHMLECDSVGDVTDAVLGVRFADASDAARFEKQIKQHTPVQEAVDDDEVSALPVTRTSVAHVPAVPLPAVAAPTEPARSTRKTIGGRLSALFGGGSSSNTGDDGSGPMVISGPVVGSVKHESHIGLTQDGTFDVNNLPKEWRAMFRSLGLRKKDLQDDPDLTRALCAVLSDAPAVSAMRERAVMRERKAVERGIMLVDGEPVVQGSRTGPTRRRAPSMPSPAIAPLATRTSVTPPAAADASVSATPADAPPPVPARRDRRTMVPSIPSHTSAVVAAPPAAVVAAVAAAPAPAAPPETVTAAPPAPLPAPDAPPPIPPKRRAGGATAPAPAPVPAPVPAPASVQMQPDTQAPASPAVTERPVLHMVEVTAAVMPAITTHSVAQDEPVHAAPAPAEPAPHKEAEEVRPAAPAPAAAPVPAPAPVARAPEPAPAPAPVAAAAPSPSARHEPRASAPPSILDQLKGFDRTKLARAEAAAAAAASSKSPTSAGHGRGSSSASSGGGPVTADSLLDRLRNVMAAKRAVHEVKSEDTDSDSEWSD